MNRVGIGGKRGKRSRELPAFNLVITGHVDHGKSTLIGRLLADTGSVPKDKIAAVEKYCAQRGKSFEYAFLLDALKEEQEQGVTIDITQIPFKTDKRRYIIIDAPGHKEFLKNMVSGAAIANGALLLIDAEGGVQEQTKRHGYILSLLRIKELIVVVNKMDLVGYSQERFLEIKRDYTAFLRNINLQPKAFIPVSSTQGDNITFLSSKMLWYKGKSILEALDMFEGTSQAELGPLRMPVQDIYKFDGRRIIAGRIESGMLAEGDSVVFLPKGSETKVKSIERWHTSSKRKTADAGECVGITIEDPLFVERGNIMIHKGDKANLGVIFSASVFWMGKEPLACGKTYRLKLVTQEVDCEVFSINKVIGGVALKEKKNKEYVLPDDAADVTLKTKEVLVFDLIDYIPSMGRFVLLDGYNVAGGGIITGGEKVSGEFYDRFSLKSRYVSLSRGYVSLSEKENRFKQKSMAVWFTGLPGSGKTTLARSLERRLFDNGRVVHLLEGEAMRLSLSSDLGFGIDERREQTRRAAEVARLFVQAGFIVIVALVSPLRKDRNFARRLIGPDRFIEVFLDCPMEVCLKRDPHGIYTKALNKELKGVTGIDSPYESPEKPDIILKTKKIAIDTMLDKILDVINQRMQNAE